MAKGTSAADESKGVAIESCFPNERVVKSLVENVGKESAKSKGQKEKCALGLETASGFKANS